MPASYPKHDPARRNSRVGTRKLPAEGFQGDVPAWPLGDTPTEAEETAWGVLWRTPQAAAWSRMGWLRTVGRYCRLMVAAEQHEASAALLAQVTALEDRLGLTPKAMRLMLWEIVEDELAEARQDGSRTSTVRQRIRAVD